MLARGSSRQRELAIRAALGAGRQQLVRQVLVESSLLGILGATIGTLLGYWAVKLLISAHSEAVPIPQTIALDWRILGFTIGVCVIAVLLFGIFPALQLSSVNVQSVLSNRGRTLAGGIRKSLRWGLAISQISLALVLLIGAGLLVKSFARLTEIDPGYEAANLLTMSISLPDRGYEKFEQQVDFFNKLLD